MSNAPRELPPAFYRFRARKALKGHWLTALQIALIVSLLPWLVRGIFSYTSPDLIRKITEITSSDALLDGTFQSAVPVGFLREYGPRLYLFAGIELAAYLLIPCLTLGMDKWMMDRLRGQDGPVTAVFGRAKLFLKACGLEIFVALKVFLWMLPGLCLTILASFLFIITGESSSEILTMFKMYILSVLPFSMIVPAFFAYVRYALAEYVMAEKPETKIRECVSRSKKLIKGNMRLIAMNILFFFLLIFLTSLFGALPSILYYVVTLLFSLVITAYWTGTLSAVYLHLEFAAGQKDELAADPGAAPEPPPENLN